MREITIEESDMLFGPFPENEVFELEKSEAYTRMLHRYGGIKTCEFVLQRNSSIYFVEAKKSCPNIVNEASPDKLTKKKYYEYLLEISQKMRDSLNVYLSIMLNCNIDPVFPNDMRIRDLSRYKFKFVLVIKKAQPEWITEYPYKFTRLLEKRIPNELNIWGIPQFIVLTEDQARKVGLICTNTSSNSPEAT